MIEECRRLSKNSLFMLSVCGLALMATPLILVTAIVNINKFSRNPTAYPILDEAGMGVRLLISQMNRCQPIMIGIGFVMPAIGLVMVVVAWSLMKSRRFTGCSRAK